MKQYSKIDKFYSVDKEKVTELAEVVNELHQLEMRIEHLNSLIKENKGLKKFLWTTAYGKTLTIFEMTDDHLKNAIIHLTKRGRRNDNLLKEAMRRFGEDYSPPKLEVIEEELGFDFLDNY